MKKIVVMPVKNEDWILEKTLACHSLWADHIIVADQNSTDATAEICRKFSKVVYIKNESPDFNESSRRQLLLDAARAFEGQNLIFALDADEIVDASVLDPKILSQFEDWSSPGASLQFEWVNLWGSAKVYRSGKSVWSPSFRPFAYYDDRKMSFIRGKIHLSRVPESSLDKTRPVSEIKVLHFQFVDFQRMMAKQRYYRVLEKIMFPKKNSLFINWRYRAAKIKGNETVSAVPAVWMAGYEKAGVDLSHFKTENFYWQDAEVLRAFGKYGAKLFAWLDIWDVDWEEKRQIALARGLAGMPGEKIIK